MLQIKITNQNVTRLSDVHENVSRLAAVPSHMSPTGQSQIFSSIPLHDCITNHLIEIFYSRTNGWFIRRLNFERGDIRGRALPTRCSTNIPSTCTTRLSGARTDNVVAWHKDEEDPANALFLLETAAGRTTPETKFVANILLHAWISSMKDQQRLNII